MKKKITYSYLKEKTGLSIGTISRYFNDGYVSQKNKDILEKIVNELNYVPDQSAATIKKDSKTLILIKPLLSTEAMADAIRAIMQANGENMLIRFFEENEKSFEDAFLWAMGRKKTGAIIIPPLHHVDLAKKLCKKFSTTENISVFEMDDPKLNYVKHDVDNAFKQLSELEDTINLIYESKKHNTFKRLSKIIEKYFKNVKYYALDELDNVNKDELVFFQYNSMLKDMEQNLLNLNFNKLLVLTGRNHWYYNAHYWIHIDYSMVGKHLYDNLFNDVKVRQVDAVLKIMKNKKI